MTMIILVILSVTMIILEPVEFVIFFPFGTTFPFPVGLRLVQLSGNYDPLQTKFKPTQVSFRGMYFGLAGPL